MRSLEALLEGIVDYAGLFPPSALPMAQAVENYARYRAGGQARMLGRFVVPVARLDEFEASLPGGASGWRLTVLAGANLETDVARVARGTSQFVDSIEIKVTDVAQVEAAVRRLLKPVPAYFEIPVRDDLRALVAAIGGAGARAKLRTGGITAEMFPPAESIARFVHACAETGVAFKATAGLHHPLRSFKPLTCSPDGPAGWMYGFLNVFVAAALVREGLEMDDTVTLLEEQDVAAFSFEDGGIAWRGHRATAEQIAAARREFAIAFGSCSFEEPVGDLKALGLL